MSATGIASNFHELTHSALAACAGGAGSVVTQATPGKSLLVAGGQQGDYANKQCVGLAEVLSAAKTYAEAGRLESSLVWDKQG